MLYVLSMQEQPCALARGRHSIESIAAIWWTPSVPVRCTSIDREWSDPHSRLAILPISNSVHRIAHYERARVLVRRLVLVRSPYAPQSYSAEYGALVLDTPYGMDPTDSVQPCGDVFEKDSHWSESASIDQTRRLGDDASPMSVASDLLVWPPIVHTHRAIYPRVEGVELTVEHRRRSVPTKSPY